MGSFSKKCEAFNKTEKCQYNFWNFHCVKIYSGLYFPAFRLNTERFELNTERYSVRMRENTDQNNS